MKIRFKHVLSAVGCLAATWVMAGSEAIAAEKIVLTYGFLSMDIPVADLEALADEGETSDELSELLNLAGQNPEILRTTLTEPIPLSPIVLDYALNSSTGEWMLNQISEVIHPASGEAGKLALRSALIGASSDDRKVTLLEVMQLYPSPEVVVQGDRLVETYNLINDVIEPLEDLADILGSIEF